MKIFLLQILILFTTNSYSQNGWEKFKFVGYTLELNLPSEPMKSNLDLPQELKEKLLDYDFYSLKNKSGIVNCKLGYYTYKKNIVLNLEDGVAGGIRNLLKLGIVKNFKETTNYIYIKNKKAFSLKADFQDESGTKYIMQNIGIVLENNTLFFVSFINLNPEIVDKIISSITFKNE
jgi:hypothetical protein